MHPPLPYKAYDADNHYYEATDAFTRHMDPRMARRAVQWVTLNGKQRLLVCGKLDRFIPNPTFDPVAKPGSLDQYFRAINPTGASMAELFGGLEPIRPEYRNREARLARMDEQGLEACFLFPTLGVGIEQPMRHDPEITHATLHAFNQWLDDDWGFAHKDRLFAAPMISLTDPQKAVAELNWCLSRRAKLVHVRPAPVPGNPGSHSLGHPTCDPFWARVHEAGITVAFHAGDSGYGRYASDWEPRGQMEAFRGNAFGSVTQADRAIYDTMAALIIHGVFHRFPRVRVCSIENGSEWVAPLLKKLKKAFGQMPKEFSEPPIDTFRRHIFVAPYYEDDIRGLADLIGVGNVLLGSDWPHAEGLADPLTFVNDLEDFREDEVRQIMRENAARLLQPVRGATV
ncbi:MAG TPA: amidohydrolase family protein [Myxococcota bacterium]|nr:amidohydrolase family protein [Myxococcota bacterium]